MTIMRDSWTDERLDDLNAKVDGGFREVKGEIADLRSEMNVRFEKFEDKVDDRFDKVDDRFDKIEDKIEARITTRIDSLNRTMLGFAVALIFLLLTSKIPF